MEPNASLIGLGTTQLVLRVILTDKNGKPLPDAVVKISDASDRDILEGITDQNGVAMVHVTDSVIQEHRRLKGYFDQGIGTITNIPEISHSNDKNDRNISRYNAELAYMRIKDMIKKFKDDKGFS